MMTIEEQVVAEAHDIFALKRKHRGSRVWKAAQALAEELYYVYDQDLFNKEHKLDKYAPKADRGLIENIYVENTTSHT